TTATVPQRAGSRAIAADRAERHVRCVGSACSVLFRPFLDAPDASVEKSRILAGVYRDSCRRRDLQASTYREHSTVDLASPAKPQPRLGGCRRATVLSSGTAHRALHAKTRARRNMA